MKKQICLFLAFITVLTTLYVSSEASSTTIQATLTRNIKLNGKNPDGGFSPNPIIPGESPTTGLPIVAQPYVPILVQIDNNHAAIPQWGLSAADIMYELPIQGQGYTRLTALFSDQYPAEAGPVRSGRVMQADLREEWDALIVHYGKQEEPGSDMREALRKYGVYDKGLAIDGISPANEKAYFSRVKYHRAPHNVTAYVQKLHAAMLTLNYNFQQRPFKFTDAINYGGVQGVEFTVIHKGNKDSSATYVYDKSRNAYLRYTQDGPYYDLLKPEIHLAYNNVIIQRTKLSWNKSSMNPLFNEVVGSGAADIFVAGKYIAGAWSRSKLSERTVFFDQNGNELELQRGKSWIVMCDDSTQIIMGDVNTSNFSDVMSEDGFPTVATPTNEASNASVVQNDSESNNATTTDIVVAAEVIKNSATVLVDNNGLLNMRKSASKGSDIISRIPNNAQVEVLDKKDDWTQIRFEGKSGYVMTSFLQFPEPVADPAVAEPAAQGTQPATAVSKEYTTLKVGDSGDEVLELKKRFAELGYFRTDKFNDRFLDSTAEAVRRFERRNKLAVDGIADPEMQAVLFSDVAVGP